MAELYQYKAFLSGRVDGGDSSGLSGTFGVFGHMGAVCSRVLDDGGENIFVTTMCKCSLFCAQDKVSYFIHVEGRKHLIHLEKNK